MVEGPYRDLGSGFARLTGVEGVRRAPSRIETVEDALFELVRNSADAGADSVYVATALHSRHYRELVVLDDGRGVLEPYRDTIFEPGVTTRHLAPSRLAGHTHGAGLSLNHIREAALSCALLSTDSPTSIRAVFDTEALPESSLQSANANREPRGNLRVTLQSLATTPGAPEIFYGSPASILTTLINARIIPEDMKVSELESWCEGKLGESPSKRTIQRVLKGRVSSAERIEALRVREKPAQSDADEKGSSFLGGGKLILDERDVSEIREVIERAARESYLEVGELRFQSRAGEISLRASIYESEGEYDE